MADNEGNVLQSAYIRSVTPNQRPEDLIRILREVVNKLREVDSGDSKKVVSKKLAEHFAQDGFLNHSDKHVRALIAACLAEMFRIFVGTEDDEMGSQGIPAQLGPLSNVGLLQAVLEFFIEQLHQFLNRQSPHYTLGYHVAQTMASTKAFTLIFSIEDHQKILEELVEMFFSVVSDKHTPMDKLVFLDILTTVIGDADVVVTPKLLTILLHPLTRDGQRTNPSAYGFAKDLLRRIPKGVEPCISSYFVNQLVFETSENEETRHNILEILLELFNISPQLVASALKHLEHQVSSNVLKDRLECVILLGEIFISNKFPEAATTDKDLLVGFAVKRLTDAEEKVRVQAVRIGKMFVCSRRTDDDKARLKDYVESIGKRFMDPSSQVRSEAIRAVTGICETALDLVPLKLVEELGGRLLDKDHHVREVCVNCICEIFHRLLYDATFVPSTAERTRTKMGPLLQKFLDTIILMPEKTVVEYKFMAKLLPVSTNEQTLANHLVYFYACSGENGRKFFEETLTKNMLIRRLFLDILSEDASKVAHRKDYQRKILSLSPELGVHSSSFDELIAKILDDAHFRNLARSFASCDIQNYVNSLDELLKRCGNPSNTNHIHQAARRLFELVVPFRLTAKLCRIIYGTVVDVLNDHITGTEFLCHHSAVPIQPEILRQRGSTLLQLIASHMPKAFCVSIHLDRMMKFWRDRDVEVALNVYRFFAACSRKIRADAQQNKRIIETLTEKALEFAGQDREICSPSEAKYAVRILNGASSDRLATFRQLIDWVKEIVESQEPDDIRRVGAAAAVGEMAACTAFLKDEQHDDNDSFEETAQDSKELETFAKEIASLVESILIPQLNFNNMEQEKDVEEGWIEKDDLPVSVQFLLENIKAIGKCLRSYRPLVLKETPLFLPILRKYVNRLKECISDPAKTLKKMSDISREHIIMCSAMQLVKTLPRFSTLEPANDLSLLFAVMPKLSSTESQEKYLRCLFRTILQEPEPGRLLAAVSSAALAADTSAYRAMVMAPLGEVVRRLRKYVIVNADRYAARLPERSLLYLLHTLSLSKDFKDSENIHDSVAWLEKIGPAIYCLLDAFVTENQQFSPGIINVLLRAAKNSHIAGHGKNRKLNHKLYTLCDFTTALMEKRFPQAAKQDSPIEPPLPADILEIEHVQLGKGAEISTNYFNTPLSVLKKSDGTVIVSIGNHDRSMSRDSDGTKNARSRRSKRSRSSNVERDGGDKTVGDESDDAMDQS